MDESTPLYSVTLTLPAGLDEDQASRFADSLGDDAVSTSLMRMRDPFHGPWQLQWVMEGAQDPQTLSIPLSLVAAELGVALPDLTIDAIPDTNWLEKSYRQFPPFSVGPFFIHGGHCAETAPSGQIDLQIEAATAFGSGEHGTTSGCLLLLDQLKRNGFTPGHTLDMGCGSGILAVAACKLWASPVLGIDIDPESVRVTDAHRDANGVDPAQLQAVAGDGFNAPSVAEHAPYDLIIANILPGPLKDMAEALMKSLSGRGRAILSGLLLDQVDDVLAVYTGLGAKVDTRLERGEWAALLLQKP